MSKSHHKSTHHEPARQRDALLTIAIILVVFHGILYTALAFPAIQEQGLAQSSVLLVLFLLAALADIVAGVAMWFWKRWGIYIFVVAGITTAIIVLIATASMTMFIGAFLHMVIVGYIVYPRLKYFG
jgi:hypothetical protein